MSTRRTGRNGSRPNDEARITCIRSPHLRVSHSGPIRVFIEFKSLTKKFAGVTALDCVSLSIRRGECHALMGENWRGNRRSGKFLPAFIARTRGRSASMGAR